MIQRKVSNTQWTPSHLCFQLTDKFSLSFLSVYVTPCTPFVDKCCLVLGFAFKLVNAFQNNLQPIKCFLYGKYHKTECYHDAAF